jgi:hypothetical protein
LLFDREILLIIQTPPKSSPKGGLLKMFIGSNFTRNKKPFGEEGLGEGLIIDLSVFKV